MGRKPRPVVSDPTSNVTTADTATVPMMMMMLAFHRATRAKLLGRAPLPSVGADMVYPADDSCLISTNYDARRVGPRGKVYAAVEDPNRHAVCAVCASFFVGISSGEL